MEKKTTFSPLCHQCCAVSQRLSLLWVSTVGFSVGVFIKKTLMFTNSTGQALKRSTSHFSRPLPKRGDKQLFLNRHRDEKRKEYLKPKISHFAAKLSWKIWGGSFFRADSTPFQLALVIVEAELRQLIKALSPLLVSFPASLPKRTF